MAPFNAAAHVFFDGIPRNFLLFRGIPRNFSEIIPRNSAEFSDGTSAELAEFRGIKIPGKTEFLGQN